MIFKSYVAAKAKVTEWKRLYPNAEFKLQQIAVGNKVGWEVVQTNRFATNGR